MTYTGVYQNLSATFGAGNNGQVFGTIYTVPANKTFFLKQLVWAMETGTGSSLSMNFYVLKSGDTDLSTTANWYNLNQASQTQTKPVYTLGASLGPGATNSATATNFNTALSAGDKINVWFSYGAVTPGATNLTCILFGDLV